MRYKMKHTKKDKVESSQSVSYAKITSRAVQGQSGVIVVTVESDQKRSRSTVVRTAPAKFLLQKGTNH